MRRAVADGYLGESTASQPDLFGNMKTTAIAFTFLILLAAGFAQAPGTAAKAPQFATPPVTMTVAQRSTTVVPGSGEALRLTVGDITRGQVDVSLSKKDGSVVLAPISLNPRGSTHFKYESGEYVLKLTKLSNALIGEDHATVFISDAASNVISEDEKIERLLKLIENSEGAVFIRDGDEHKPEAAAHLRNKWYLNETKSARQFIEDNASRSTQNKTPYQMRLRDGSTVSVGDFLRERLAEMERTK